MTIRKDLEHEKNPEKYLQSPVRRPSVTIDAEALAWKELEWSWVELLKILEKIELTRRGSTTCKFRLEELWRQ